MEVLLKPVEIVACFQRDGRLRPLRMRLIGDDTGYKVIGITKVIREVNERVGFDTFKIYTCTGSIDNLEKIFELKYEVSNGSWCLYRM